MVKIKTAWTVRTKFILGALGLLLLLAVAGGGFWLATPYSASSEVESALMSDSVVKVSGGQWIVFEPRSTKAETGFIVYPGGRVEPEAYAPTARALAERGYLVVIARVPLNLAVLASNAAGEIIDTYRQIDQWAIGGHSLGGAMAARFTYRNPDAIAGLVLWASFPARSDDLSERELAVVSIYGDQDGVASPEEVLAAADRMPPDTRFVAIEGGNHAQFGWYGPQSGDGQAKISRADQQQIIIETTSQLLERIFGSESLGFTGSPPAGQVPKPVHQLP